MLADTEDHDLLAIQVATRFVMTDSSRILYENSPDQLAAPRLYLAGCRSGNVVRLRHDVGEETARAIEILAEDEPALREPDSTPVHLGDYVRLLVSEAPVERWDAGLIWTFPNRLAYEDKAALVASETPDGDRFVARIMERGMPEALVALGCVGVRRLVGSVVCGTPRRRDSVHRILGTARAGGCRDGCRHRPGVAGR